jgi:hypothetical protein
MVRGPFTKHLRYIGLSSDDKPADISIGSVFYETDSFVSYIYTGSAWVELV